MATTSLTDTLDVNLQGDTSSSLLLVDQTVITLSVLGKTGANNNHRIIIQQSPDRTNWIDTSHSILGVGSVTCVVSSSSVRAKVAEAERSSATVQIYLSAS